MVQDDLVHLLFEEVSLIYIHLEHYEVVIEKYLSQLKNARSSIEHQKSCLSCCSFSHFYIQINFPARDPATEVSSAVWLHVLEAPALCLK